ncbi:MAG: ketopantoate reductase family protein [Proteobacteria bacterium]|nr:ketopantoate reductase family protein [Pseudomonadota bacterium]
MNVLILGAGAIGSVFGGFLARGGHRVCLIGRPSHIEAIQKSGLFIAGIWGEHVIRNLKGYVDLSALSEQEKSSFDTILLTVKSYDTDAMLNELKNNFPTPPPVVSLQNGLGNIEKIEAHLGREKTIGGRVIFGVEFVAPGSVRITVSADRTVLGGLSGGVDNSFVEKIAQAFTASHITAEAVPDINRYIWGKVLYNCALNGLATLINVHYGKLLSFAGTKDIMAHIVREIFTIIRRKNISVEWETSDEYVTHLFGTLIPRTFDHHPSMLQDIMRHKRTEIDALNGALVRLGNELGIDLPYNWTVTQLIKAKEDLNV